MNSGLTLTHDKKTISEFKPKILSLFEKCFGSPLSESLWNWAYLENPCGDPYVCLAFFEGELVGHYAAIPQDYANSSQSAVFILSMTTMVHPKHRSGGLFKEMAEMTYAEAERNGVHGVLGFPNKNSLPGFKKRLEWLILENTSINCFDVRKHSVQSGQRSKITKISQGKFFSLYKPDPYLFSLNLKNETVFNWRVSKPGKRYCFGRLGDDLFIFKEHGDGLDIVFSTNMNDEILLQIIQFAQENHYSSVSMFNNDEVVKCDLDGRRTPYCFGYRIFGGDQYPFIVSLIMSDVF